MHKYIFLFFIFMGTLGGCTPAEREIISGNGRIIDALNRPYLNELIPERIISLSPAVTEILFAIGAGEKVVGVTEYCDYPEEALNKTSIGGFAGATMSLEQIWSLEPDLVILSADMHERIVMLLDELGISSFAVEPRNFSDVYDVINLIGFITGFSENAEELTENMKKRIAEVEVRIGGRPKPDLLWLLSENPLMSVGRGTFVSQAIDLAGGRNIFDDVNEQWPLISPEQILMRRPQWVITEMQTGQSMSAGITMPFWQTLPAVRDGRVVEINTDLFYRYGPRLAEAVEILSWILHP